MVSYVILTHAFGSLEALGEVENRNSSRLAVELTF